MTTLDVLTDNLLERLPGLEPGDALAPIDEALIHLGVQSSVTALDHAMIDRAIEAAIAAGATIDQIQEVVTMVSGLGTHSLMVAVPMILAKAAAAGLIRIDPLDTERLVLWDRYVGDSSYWRRFEGAVPGFLDALIRLSPDVFQGFFEYCALPSRTRSIAPVTSELIALATDATPSHVFPPGAHLHLLNALKLGAGKTAVLRTLEIARAGHSPAATT